MIEIVPYKASWPIEFAGIASQLRLGLRDLAIRIDHIGSTSVPNLAAKDIIDIQITVATLDETIKKGMTEIGYILPPGVWRDHAPPGFTGPETDWQKLLFREPEGERRINVHVRVQGRPNQRYPLLFRDYLRAHPASAESYALLKQQLVENLKDLKTYPAVKDPAVDLIYMAAEAWAGTINWRPGPSNA